MQGQESEKNSCRNYLLKAVQQVGKKHRLYQADRLEFGSLNLIVVTLGKQII